MPTGWSAPGLTPASPRVRSVVLPPQMEWQPGGVTSLADGDERHVPLDSCFNFRDLGGYRTRDDRQVRRRCLYRSAELCSLTDADHDTLVSLGIKVVFDLRGEPERAARPSRLPASVELHERTSPSTRSQLGPTLEEQIAAGTLPERDDDYLAAVYIRQLDDGLACELRRILELALHSPTRPILFHCAAGKDRTGLAAAVILGVLGVPDDTISADYNLSSIYWAEPRLQVLRPHLDRHGVSEHRVRPFLEARSAVLERAVQHIHHRWGGFDAYATDCLGVAASLPNELRSALTA